MGFINKINIKDILSELIVKINTERAYKKITSSEANFKRSKGIECAVVIHLFYTDNWPLFNKKLGNLRGHKFDLYITIPAKNISFIGEIKKFHPEVRVIVVPNHGRDVLPFVKVASKLTELGYKYLLKFHSKKSTHRMDGQKWLEDMLDQLLPDDPHIINSIFSRLKNKKTGVIGPNSVYYPLTVNFPANGPHMMRLAEKLYGKSAAHKYLQTDRREYGFFGGTMFWVRLDAIKDLLCFSSLRFEIERGQIDATFAHALERLFSVVPEINGRVNYEVSKKGIFERLYKSDNIPDWSEDHLK